MVPCGVVVAALISSDGEVAAQGVLRDVRDEVRSDRPDDPIGDSSKSWDDDDDDDNFIGLLFEPNIRSCEVYIGYDYGDVGGANLGGFITGLRFWH
jgi:hypothetical protein